MDNFDFAKLMEAFLLSPFSFKQKNSDECTEFTKIEFGNFDDRDLSIFRKVTTNQVSCTSFKVFWKENGDLSLFFFIYPHKYWIEINRNIVKKIINVDHECIAIIMDQAPNVHRQDGHNNKTRMAAPTDIGTQYNSFWLHNFNLAKTLLLSGIKSEHKETLKSQVSKYHIYGFKSCQYLTMKEADGFNWKGELQVQLGVPFQTMYLLLCLNSKVPGLLASYEMLLELKKLFKEFKEDTYHLLNGALEKCLQHEDFFPSEFIALFKKHTHKRQHKSFVKGDDNIFEIRKVLITPTGIKYFPKILESGNRVLRKYKQYQDHFIRITFCDEGLNKVNAEKVTNMHPRLTEFINNGLKIGDRHYEMLANSNSQLRSHSCWFLNTRAEIREISKVDNIIRGLGDFSDIKVMAKYTARVGQCFSNTAKGIKADFVEVGDIVCRETLENGDIKEHILNDGCGRMSPEFAELVSKEMKIRMYGKPYIPSAFQFRLGGNKGVLVQNKETIELFGKDLVLTKSQNKFKDESNDFELVNYSKRPKFSTLNRQIIVLLSSNGLPDSTLMGFLDKELKTWESRTTNKFSLRKLLRMIWGNTVGSNIKNIIASDKLDVECKHLATHVEGMQKHIQYFYNVDPLLCMLCDKIMIAQFSKLKTNIPVDKCSVLLGVVDFDGVLEDDEVFIQLSPFEKFEQDLYEPGSYAEGGIVSGDVFVTRNPCLHPGDIRKLRAVNDERINGLKHLTNVIVFSRKSTRSQASKMSGGDLDGDIFMVVWDTKLLNFTEHEPMEHSQMKPIERNTGFDFMAIRDFFKEYVVNDNLGVVAFMHMEQYDQSPEGALDPTCLELADYHSHQVDYAKTGVRKALSMELVSNRRPHYMPKCFGKTTYHSDKILGQIYDKVEQFMKSNKKLDKKKVKQFGYHPHFKVLDKLYVKYKPLQMLFKEHDQFKQVENSNNENSLFSKDIADAYHSIKKLYKEYKSDLKDLTSLYYVSETELVVGSIDFKKLEHKCGTSSYKLKDQIQSTVDKFITYYANEAKKIVKAEGGELSKQEIASIFYIVVRNDNIHKEKFKKMFGLSFYWLVIDKIVSCYLE